jgi:hypothetical protein
MSSKIGTFVLGVFVATVIFVLTAVLVLYNKKFIFTKSFRQALRVATSNDMFCALQDVQCEFLPDTNVMPPPPDVVSRATSTSANASSSAATVTTNFSLPAAKFAAQVVAILEKAASQSVAPVPRGDTTVLALLSGADKNKNLNIGWILKVKERNQIWVAFRGTQTKAEWKQDFKMSQIPLGHTSEGPVLVHQGFSETYDEIKEAMKRTLLEHMIAPSPESVTDQNTTLYITGHSLGAALAVLAVFDILAREPMRAQFTDVRCYIFGAPRVGNPVFVDSINAMFKSRAQLTEFFVIANDDDIVPNIPLAVQPNLDCPSKPWIYSQFAMQRFSANWGSWTHNHTLPIHISYLNNLVSE